MTFYFIICPGIEILAEAVLRICPLRMHHSIACWMVLKLCGLERKKLCMLASASIAVPSTTSITTHPINDSINSNEAICTQMAPPIEWPTSMIGGAESGYNLAMINPTSLKHKKEHIDSRLLIDKNALNYLASVLADKSDSFETCVSPWPLRSIAKHWQSIIAVISVCAMKIYTVLYNAFHSK